MEYIYNNRKDYISIQIENRPNEKLSVKNVPENCSTILDIFKLLFTEEMIISLAKESKEYALSKFIEEDGEDWKNKKLTKNSYKWYYINHGITSNDIKLYLAAIIFMGIIKLPRISNYWENNSFYQNILPNYISKNKFYFLSFALHLPIEEFENNDDNNKDGVNVDKDDNNENFEENNNDNIEDKEDNINKKDPRYKCLSYLNEIIKNSKKYVMPGINITIDETLVFFRGRSNIVFYSLQNPQNGASKCTTWLIVILIIFMI